MIEAVIDSVTMHVAVRPVKAPNKSAKKQNTNPLEMPVRQRKLRLALDSSRGLSSEWERTCGPAAKAFVIHCEQYGGIRLIENLGKPGSAASKQLRQLGFDDAVDKLIVKIALATNDRIIVSGESDFWDPKKPHNRQIPGQANAPVARFLREQLGITVLLLRMLMTKMR